MDDIIDSRPLRGPSAGQLVHGIDHIYADYRNRHVPIVRIVKIVMETFRGSSDAEIEKRFDGQLVRLFSPLVRGRTGTAAQPRAGLPG